MHIYADRTILLIKVNGRDLTRGVGGITYGWRLLYCALEYAAPRRSPLGGPAKAKNFTAKW
jgi:hypothetical protein